MNAKVKDRHLYGAGAAACAVCCAPPLLALLGLAGAGLAATIATIAFAGLTFGVIVLAASSILWARRRRSAAAAPCPEDAPVEVAIGARPPDAPGEFHAGH